MQSLELSPTLLEGHDTAVFLVFSGSFCAVMSHES